MKRGGGVLRPRTEAFWPTADQTLLLKAALLRGPAALEAWNGWKSRNDVVEAHLDRGSFRLLPLLYRNLQAQGVEEPLLPRLRGVYRYFWCANQNLVHESTRVLASLSDAGIPTVVLKGAAVSALFYKDWGVRPMSDVDVLVPSSRVLAAVDCLEKLDWRPTSRRFREDFRFRHSARMMNPAGQEFDLHWHPFRECLRDDLDAALWRHIVPLKLFDVDVHSLHATETLLHTIVHGLYWNQEPVIRWIPDAMAILRSEDSEIDWERMLEQARLRQIRLRLWEGLRYLIELFDAPIPEPVCKRLAVVRPSYVERFEYRYIGLDKTGKRRVFLGHYPYHWIGFLRYTGGRNAFRKAMDLPDFLRYSMRLPSRWGILPLLFRHAARKSMKMIIRRQPAGDHLPPSPA